MFPVIAFPTIDPVALELGPLVVRWYALAYIVGLIGGWRYALYLARREPVYFEPKLLDDFVVWATLGVVIGGRLGYVLFYRPGYYLSDPIQILMVWQGGMAFHGGMLGVVVATFLFARKNKVPLLPLADIVCAAAPIGLFFGRIANFINGELYGRASDVPWAMVFPHGGPEPRHPSQLYQAGMEGLILFIAMTALVFAFKARNKPGLVAGAFFLGYGIARFIGELFRQPDSFLGFLAFGTTMGQLLSLPMMALGAVLIGYALKRK
ncbi:prolipoprotein diacylglyceryl transferase [Oceanibaculum pacificum]|uniref:Phosphatidylglycerol--prolipoprotein diacylglyceryl transferase n=1 Tax=Oceanibaculum pacificum TaxID=580166 RepID=A0A154WD63_9PROT|nr:prolipoprotein diacylglyceryl transferase [Oceanibaculum pacificum]KZD11468.1 prolipoprotein diacylglyceryl transferase [Oceanibaculum pacificum]